MSNDLPRWVAAISPENYCARERRRDVRRVIESANPDWKRALDLAVPVSPDPSDPFPRKQFMLGYDCLDDSLESVYFSLLDAIQAEAGWEVLVLSDSIEAALGSGFFQDLSRKGVTAQHEAARLMAGAQALVRSMLSAVSEVREFQSRLRLYDQLRSPQQDAREAALLGLKQRWLDETGAGRRAQSLNRTVDKPFLDGFLEPHAFHSAQDSENENPVLCNGVLRGILDEFHHWLGEDERELRSRIDLGRHQLRAQLETLKLQARWLRPHLQAAEQLNAVRSASPALVTAFNTALFELTLLALHPVDVPESAERGGLAGWMQRRAHRDYSPAVVIELSFRSAPLRAGGGSHVHRGKVEIRGTSYALHQAELETLRRQHERDELAGLMHHLGVATPANVEALLLGLEEHAEEQCPKPARVQDDDNPFTALLSGLLSAVRWLAVLFLGGRKRSGLEPDSRVERRLRQHAARISRDHCHRVAVQLKSSLGMALTESGQRAS